MSHSRENQMGTPRVPGGREPFGHVAVKEFTANLYRTVERMLYLPWRKAGA